METWMQIACKRLDPSGSVTGGVHLAPDNVTNEMRQLILTISWYGKICLQTFGG